MAYLLGLVLSECAYSGITLITTYCHTAYTRVLSLQVLLQLRYDVTAEHSMIDSEGYKVLKCLY